MKKHNFYAGPSILSEYTIKNTATSAHYVFAKLEGVGVLVNPYQYPQNYQYSFYIVNNQQGGSMKLIN